MQYPGVAESIDSDIDNLSAILKMWDMLPEGECGSRPFYTCLKTTC